MIGRTGENGRSSGDAGGEGPERVGARFGPKRGPDPTDQPHMRVLLVSNRRSQRDRFAKHLTPAARVAVANCAGEAALMAEECDVVVIDAALPDATGFDLAEELAARGTPAATVIVSAAGSAEDAMLAMRSGAVDLIDPSVRAGELRDRIENAYRKQVHVREREERLARLEHLCKHLNLARREVSEQVGGLCTDLAQAYQDLSDRAAHASDASEFNSVIRQELDLEDLLRTSLEYLLAKLGPTNAAIFLPASDGDFSLGAYVNYDCPKDTCEVLLDQLANVMAPRFEHAVTPQVLETEADLERALGEESDWLRDHRVLVIACRHDDECLAVLSLFRDRHTPFPEGSIELIGLLGQLFGRQLARVIHVHHRHLPKDEWGSDAGFSNDAPGDLPDDFTGDGYDDLGRAA